MKLEADDIYLSPESLGLREFIHYVFNRIIYLKIAEGDISSNEYKYHCILWKRIKQWGAEHKIFFKYLMGDITAEQAQCCYGMFDRTFERITRKQRKELIEFIEEHERVLGERYPFPTESDMFDGERNDNRGGKKHESN